MEFRPAKMGPTDDEVSYICDELHAILKPDGSVQLNGKKYTIEELGMILVFATSMPGNDSGFTVRAEIKSQIKPVVS